MANRVLDRILGRPTPPPLQPVSPWQDPNTLIRTTWAELFDLDYLPVTRETGMGLGVLAKGRHLLTGAVSGFPIVGMSGNLRADRQPGWCAQPEIGRPRSTTIAWAMDSEYWYGRVWYQIVKRYSEDSRPSRFRWVPEWAGEYDPRGNLIRAFGEDVDPANLIRVDGPHEGIVNFGQRKIREALAIEAAAANASDNPVPSVDLHQTGGDPLDDNQIDSLVARWVAARRKKGGGVGYTNQSIEAKAMGQAVEQLLIAARQQSDLDLARLAGLPAWGADVSVEGANLTYSNSPSRARELIDFFLSPYMTPWTDRFSMDDVLPSGQWVRFDTSAILRGTFKERMEGYQTAIASGVFSVEQCQLMEAGIGPEGN